MSSASKKEAQKQPEDHSYSPRDDYMTPFPDGITWHYVSDPGRRLLDRVKEKPGEIQEIKQSRQRRVFRLVEHGLYVKEIRYNGLRGVVKTFSGGNAVKEGRIALKLMQKGIAVPEVMAFGTKTSNRILSADVLITQEVVHGESVNDFILNYFKELKFKSKCKTLSEFAGFVKKIHDAGIFHHDFHFKNLIVQRHEACTRFYVLDLDKVTLWPGPLPWRKRIQQIGVLFSISWGMLSRNQCFRFIREYGFDIRQNKTKRLFDQIRKYAARHVHRILSQRSRQSVFTNTRFTRKTANGLRMYYPRKENNALEEGKYFRLAAFIGKWHQDVKFQKQGGDPLKQIQFEGRSLIVKRYCVSEYRQWLKTVGGLSYGQQIWKGIWRFPEKKIKVVPVVMMIEKNRIFCNKKAYVVFESPENTIPLHAFWAVINEVDKKGLCAKLGIIIGSMHGMGCFHGNLRWENILVCPGQGNNGIVMAGIDQAGLIRWPCGNKAKRDLIPFLADMDRFCGDEKCRAFFLKCWRKWAGGVNRES